MSKPFLKWAGGKYTQLADLFVHIPAGKRLIEPFVGGGSVFLNSDKHADFLLADVNPDLINLYQMLALVPDAVENHARWIFEHMGHPDGYELIRKEFNAQTLDTTERASAFLYLNRHCYNGLMRYNLAHQFNVGWGKYKAPYFPFNELKAFADMAHNCVFMTSGFRRTIDWPARMTWCIATRLTSRCLVLRDIQRMPLVALPGMTRSFWQSVVLKPTNVARGLLFQTHLHRRFSTCTGSMVLTWNSSKRAVRSPAKAVRGKSQKTL